MSECQTDACGLPEADQRRLLEAEAEIDNLLRDHDAAPGGKRKNDLWRQLKALWDEQIAIYRRCPSCADEWRPGRYKIRGDQIVVEE
jgi:hypothetical protein